MLSHREQFAVLEKEFESKYSVWIGKTKERKIIEGDLSDKKEFKYETIERSKIVSRFIDLCGDEKKEEFESREYHLCKLIQHSFKSFDEEKHKNQKIRTIKLLSDDDPFTLDPLIIIAKSEVKEEGTATLDFRAETLESKELKAGDTLEKEIYTVMASDTLHSMFFKNSRNVGPLKAAKILEGKELEKTINTEAIVEYATLCHVLENNPNLLDVDLEFFSDERRLSDQLKFLLLNVGDLLTIPHGIKILNAFGFRALYQEHGPANLVNFKKVITSLPNGLAILEAYYPILKFISLDFIQTHHEELFSAIGVPDKINELIFRYREIYTAFKNSDSQYIEKNISQPVILAEIKKYDKATQEQIEVLSDIIVLALEKNLYRQEEWLQLIAQSQPFPYLYQFITQRYIAKYINQYATLEEWLIATDPKYQIELFNFLESQGKKLNYFMLYALSDVLKELPAINRVIAEHRADALQLIQTRYVLEERDEKELKKNKSFFTTPPPEPIAIDVEQIERTSSELKEYQRKYLYVDSKGQASAGLASLTPSARAAAYNHIALSLQKSKEAPGEFERKLLDEDFKKSVTGKFNIRPLHFFDPLLQWAEDRKQKQAEIDQYWETRTQICRRVENNDVLLLELLLDIDVLNNLTQEELGLLFEKGNKALFAEIMVLAYPGRPFTPFQSGRKQIDIQLLKQWVISNESIPELNRVNRARFEHKIPQYIPVGAKYPGIYPGDAALSKYQLYQLQDLDIQVAEEILFEEYKDIIQPLEFYNLTEQESKGRSHYRKVLKKEVEYIAVRNQVDQKDKKQEKKVEFVAEKNEEDPIKEKLERKTERLESDSTLKTIYLVPMNPAEAVLIDPDKQKHPHFRTYNEFKNKIRLVVNSIDFGKSAIIAGICNLNGNHYVPYFIYKDTKGKIYVLTIDPSHETSPILRECFGDIFPHSLYADAHITQQVRQRDCGFNSLESIRIAAESLLSRKPLISVVDDVLYFDPSQLTVNGEPFKGFDHQRKQMYFLREFIQQGEKVRDKWSDWLKQKNKVRYSTDNVSDYDYMGNIEAQEAGDNLDGVYSVIASLMIRENLLEEYRQQYIDKLELPTSQQLQKIKKRLEDLKDLPKETLDEVAADAICIVCKINFKQNTVLGLLNIFKNVFLPHCQVNKDSTESSLYLEFTKTEKYIEFSKLLSAVEIVDFRKQAQHAAQEKLKETLLYLKEKFIFQYVHINIEKILKSINTSSDKTIEAIIVYLADHKDTSSDIELLLHFTEVRRKLEQFIYKEVQEFTVKKAHELWNSIERNPMVLRQESIFDYKQDSIQLNVYELEHALNHGSPERKIEQLEEKSGAQHIYKVHKKANYYELIQLVISNNYSTQLIEKITEQLYQFVNSVIYDPRNLEYVHGMNSSQQIMLSMSADYTDFFIKMMNNLGYDFSFPVSEIYNSFHRKQLYDCIQTQMKIFTRNIIAERFQNRYNWLQEQTTYSDLLELKDEDPGHRLLVLCLQKNIIINPGETIYDFVSIYQNQYSQDENQIQYSYGFINVKLMDSRKIIDFCNEHKLFTKEQNDSINKQLIDLSKRFNELTTSSLSKCYFELSRLIVEMKSFILKIVFELFDDPRYILGSDVPGSYTYYVRHLLCSIFDLPEVNKLILTSKESRDLDHQIKLMPTLREQYYPAYHDFSQHLLGKVESKLIPKTYGRPLSWAMLIECLQYWRANRSHPHPMTTDDGLDERYFKLLEMVNTVSVEDLHLPLPFAALENVKKILNITNDFSAQFQTWVLLEPKSSADLAIGAVLNSNSFSSERYPKKIRLLMPDEPLEIKHIQMLTELYFGTKEVKNLPKATIELMNDLKLTGMHVVKGYSPINPPEYYFLENTIRAISDRHPEQKESFILDYTDVQILKKAINYYVIHFKHSRDMLNNKENTAIDCIFTVLAVLIQANTLDATPVAELLMPHVKLVPSSERVPLSELMRASNLLVAKESADFYQKILHEAKEICTNEQMLNISAFIDIISRFDQINPSLMSASGPVKMNAQFKKCVENARTANRLKDLLIMISEKDKPMNEMLDQVLLWSEMLNNKHVQEMDGLFLIS